VRGRYTIVKEFGFEAAHRFPHKPAGHSNTRMHGHSFRVEVALSGTPDAATGCVADFEALDAALGTIKADLDHRLLNDIDGIGTPSLENLARWIADRLRPAFGALASVTVRRPSLGESARYEIV
jgi:6-pyruvoyltetrahydropterin/6-carboxytetrahydropterin synthase